MIRIVSWIGLLLLLSGCAAERAYDNGRSLIEQGKVTEGLVQLEKAYKLDPGNNEFKARYFRTREAVAFQTLSQADAARANGQWDDAAVYYKQALKIDPDNPRAIIGLSALPGDRKRAALLSDARSALAKGDVAAAAGKVQSVLVEAPSDPDALSLERSIETMYSVSDPADAELRSKLAHPITMEFKDSPIQTVFDYISRVSGINFILDKEVRPDLRANLFVRDARIEDVIHFILVANQLEQRVLNGNTLFIYANTPQKLKDFQELQVKNFYLVNASAKDVAAAIKGIVKTKDLYVDEKANLIVMRDTPDAIRVADRLVAAEDVAEPEVVLELEVLEVDSNVLDNIGIQYPSQLSFSVVGAAGTPGTVTLPEYLNRNAGLVRATITDPALVINLLHQDGDANLLANPKIRVKNHEKANVHVGERVPVITNTTTSTGFISQSVNYLDVGLKLDVEPTVYLDNDVGIKVSLEVSSITKQIQDASGGLTYQIGTRNASTVLRLRDNETQMLAGLINRQEQDTSSGVPGLGEIPGLGRLFSSHTASSAKSEIVLLITPHVVRNIVRSGSPLEEYPSGTESAISLHRLHLNQVTEKAGAASADTQQAAPAKPATSATAPVTDVQLSLQAPQDAAAGKEFAVRINLAAAALQNALLDLGFDPAKLKVVKVEEGDFLGKPDGKAQFLQQVQEGAGRINLSVIRQGNVQGAGTMAVVTFQALDKEAGDTHVKVISANFSDAAGRALPAGTLPETTVRISR